MTATVAGIHLGIDTHANRPAGNSCPDGSMYSCSTHGLIYKSNFAGNSWATWATLGAAASGSITASGYTQNTARLLGRTTASSGAIEEITVGSGLSLSAGSLTATGSSSFVGAKAYMSTTQSVNGSNVALTLDTELFDTNTFHDTGSNTSRMTIPSGKDGYYLVEGQTFVNSTTDWFGIRLNNTSYVRGSTQNLPSAGRWQISCIVNLVATDYIEMQANTSGAITFGFASTNPDAQTVLAISFLGA